MLRVLRPGGWLLTAGDPFRPDHAGLEHELDVFERHPAVLLGVNESIPTLGELVATFVAHQDRLDVELHAGPIPRVGGRAKRLYARLFGREGSWQLDERKALASGSGTVAMRARVKRRLTLDPLRQAVTVLRAGDYAEVLGDDAVALATLVPLLPDAFVDMPFPGERQTKFELLNGWRAPRAGSPRTGYRRARWFLTRPDHAGTLRFSVASTKRGGDSSIVVRIDGQPAVNDRITSEGWLEVSVPLAGVPPAARFVCEIEVALPDAAEVDAQFDDYCFWVKDRRFA
jgi:hypothetical protein